MVSTVVNIVADVFESKRFITINGALTSIYVSTSIGASAGLLTKYKSSHFRSSEPGRVPCGSDREDVAVLEVAE